MSRLKIQLPENFHFSCTIPIRITDLNYGGHVGNDTVLSLIHEARIQYLNNIGYSEMNFAGTGMIMADVAIEFKSEIFYGDIIIAHVTPGEISKIGFELFYKLETYRKQQDNNKVLIANAKSSMICYDYEKKKIVAIPDEAKTKLLNKD